MRRLIRHFVSNLVYNDLIGRNDVHTTFIGGLVGFGVISAAAVLALVGKYNSVAIVPGGRFKSALWQTVADKIAMAGDDKALFLAGAMTLLALLVVMSWDALVLDERDFAILRPLPIPTATVILAKAAAVTLAASTVIVSLNLLVALILPWIVFAKTSVSLLTIVRWTAAYALSGFAGSAAIFATLLAIRQGLHLLPQDRVRRMATATLQFILALTLLALLLNTPTISRDTIASIRAGHAWVAFYPPAWFLALEETLIGQNEAAFAGLAVRAIAFLIGSFLLAAGTIAVSMLSERARRPAAAGSPSSAAGRLLALYLQALTRARLIDEDRRCQAGFCFTCYALTRSVRHRLYVACALGAALAVSGAALAAAYGYLPGGALSVHAGTGILVIQLNAIFFLVIGMRLAAAVPADIGAAWIFRFHASPTRERYLAGARGAIFFCVLLPLLMCLAPLYALRLGAYATIVHFAFGVVASLLLLEVAFDGYRRLPFVSEFAPGRALLSGQAVFVFLGYLAFILLLPAAEWLLINRPGMAYLWIALFVIVVGRLRSLERARVFRDGLPVFDDAASDVEQLGLWNAVPIQHDAVELHAPPTQRVGRGVILTPEAQVQEQRSWRMLFDKMQSEATEIGRECRYAARRLRLSLGYTFFAVGSLALGVLITTAIYSLIYSSVLRPLDAHDIKSLVNVYHASPYDGGSRARTALSLEDFRQIESQQLSFSQVAAHAPFGQVLIAQGHGERVMGELVTGRYFEVLGIQPESGRLIHSADDLPEAPAIIVISDRLWRGRFNGAATIVGSTLFMAGRPFVVAGVTPAQFRGVEFPNLAPTDVWVPLSQSAVLGGPAKDADPETRWLVVKGRLRPGRTVEDAAAEMSVIAHRLDLSRPIGRLLPASLRTREAVSRPWRVVPVSQRLVSERSDRAMGTIAALSMAAVGLVLLVATSNIANLALARGAQRCRDFAVRRALGASRWQVVRPQIIEGAIVAAMGAVTASLAAPWFIQRVLTGGFRYGPWINLSLAPQLDVHVGLFGLAMISGSLLVFAVLPALLLTGRAASLRSASGAATHSWRGGRTLIGLQVAVSVFLVVVAGLCAMKVRETSRGSDSLALDKVAAISFRFDAQGWTETQARQFIDRVSQETGRQPAIEIAAVASDLLLDAGAHSSANLQPADAVASHDGSAAPRVPLVVATPEAIQVLARHVIAGRCFDARDGAEAARVTLLTERSAHAIFGRSDVVGRVARWRSVTPSGANRDIRLTVVGVLADLPVDSGETPVGAVYVPWAQNYTPHVSIVSRGRTDGAQALAALQSVARRVNPEAGVVDAASGAALAGLENVAFETMATVTALLGAFALLLALVGLYGVLSYVVQNRTRELGLRLALGASRRQVEWMIVTEGVRPVIFGVVLGCAMGDVVQMVLESVIRVGLPPVHLTLLLILPLPFLAAGLVACYVPSRRASGLEPNEALRSIE